MKKVDLYAGAETKSYYKYMDEPLWLPTPEEIAELKKKGNPAEILEFEDRTKLMADDYIPERPAIYFSKHGGLVVSSTVEVPDITPEMAAWWFAWHPLDPLRYAIWEPQDHYDISISEEGRRRLMDKSIPMDERIWGVPNHVLEAFNGEKPAPLTIQFDNPALFGYPVEKIGTDNCLYIFCMNDRLKKGPLNIPVFATEMLRKSSDGKNLWISHWWMGSGFENGQVITKKIPFRPMVAQYASNLVVHNRIEMKHLNKILPSVYSENKDNWYE